MIFEVSAAELVPCVYRTLRQDLRFGTEAVFVKYTSLEEEQDNLVTRIFVPALEKVGTEAHKPKICVHEKTGFFRV